MSGATFHETLMPWQTADFATVTLAGTNKALYTPGNFPILGGHFFGFIGKKLHIRLFGKITTGATPGTLPDPWVGRDVARDGDLQRERRRRRVDASTSNDPGVGRWRFCGMRSQCRKDHQRAGAAVWLDC
jgi:hypothetical protein